MAKTLAKIEAYKRPTIRGLKQALADYKTSYEASHAEVKALQSRNEDLEKWRDEARSRADGWYADSVGKAAKIADLEARVENLRGTVERLRERLEVAGGNMERLQGWIDCKQGRDPRIETEIPF